MVGVAQRKSSSPAEPISSVASSSDSSGSTDRTRAHNVDDEEEEQPAAPDPVGADPEKIQRAASPQKQHQQIARSQPVLEDNQQRNIVDWEGPDDPQNPLNRSTTRKWVILLVLGSATLCVTCASVRPFHLPFSDYLSNKYTMAVHGSFDVRWDDGRLQYLA